MELAGEAPDFVVGCVGGGSNFAGLAFPFMADRCAENSLCRCRAHRDALLHQGVYAYDFGDTGKLTPLVKMFTLGHTFMPAGIHAGGLRYHGMAPLLCALYSGGWLEAVSRARRIPSSRRPFSSPAPRASSRRPNRPTP